MMNENTIQTQTVTAVLIISSHFKHCQQIHVLNHTHRIVGKGVAINNNRLTLRTVLQVESTIGVTKTTMLPFREAVLPNHNALQLLQSNQLHLVHKRKAVISNLQSLQLAEMRQIQ